MQFEKIIPRCSNSEVDNKDICHKADADGSFRALVAVFVHGIVSCLLFLLAMLIALPSPHEFDLPQ